EIVNVSGKRHSHQVIWFDLPICACGANPQPLRSGYGLLQGCGSSACIQCHRIDDIELIDIALFQRKKDIAFLLRDGAAEFETISPLARRRSGHGQRVGSVERAGTVSKEQGSVPRSGAWLGFNLNPGAQPRRVLILGREQVRIHTNGSDGTLWRQRATVLKAIDRDDCTAGRPASTCSKSLQLAKKIIWIIRKSSHFF